MTRESVNGYGVENFGPRKTETQLGTRTPNALGRGTLVVTFDFDTLPIATQDSVQPIIPANSFIELARFRVLKPFTGGVSYNFGLSQRDGTVIDVDGIESVLLLGDINVLSETVICTGALVLGLAGIGVNDGVFTVGENGTFTAGRGVIYIDYYSLDDRASGNN